MVRRPKTNKARLLLLSSAAVAVLASFAIAIYAGYGFVAGSETKREIAKLRAKGEPVTVSEVAPPPIPDDRNGAVIFALAFKLLPSGASGPDIQLLNDFVDVKTRPYQAEHEVRRLLMKYDQAYRLALKAVDKPECRFPVQWEKGWEANTPHYKDLRKLATLVAARTIVKAGEGDTDQAIDSIILGVKIANSIQDEPSLLALSVRGGLLKTALSPLSEALSAGRISESKADELEGLLSRIDLVKDGVNALRGERAISIHTMRRFADRVSRSRGVHSGGRAEDERGTLARSAASRLVRTLFRRDEALYIRRMTTYMERAERPYREMARRGRPGPSYGRQAPRQSVFSAVLLPPLGYVLRQRDDAIAHVSASRVLLALSLYKQRTGTYPSALDKIGSVLPEDPFSGKSFIYRRKGSGLILYSLGPNLQDDGGISRTEALAKPKPQPFASDIVWRLEQ